MNEQFIFDVFLSHSSRDKAVVRPLAERLRKDGLWVWFDEWEIKPGDSIPAKIEKGLEQARVLVLCMSASAFGSDWSQLESHTFRFRDPLNKGRRLIPLRLDDAIIKGSLAQFRHINWRTPAERDQEYVGLREACSPPATLQPGRQAETCESAGEAAPTLRVVHVYMHPLLRDLEESLADGTLRDSKLGPLVLAALANEKELRPVRNYNPLWIAVGIRLSDEYFAQVWQSAGERDWQRDFAQTVTPILVGVTRSLERSPDAQALVIRLCKTVAERLRLTLVWPEESDRLNDVTNAIYKACLKATELENDDVLSQLKALTVVGPS